jgi:hypothetical protein
MLPRFPAFEQISNGDLYSLSLTNNTATLTHSLHRFPAKYIPQVPAWAIEEFGSPNATVLDPFCGSGTTLVEALLRSRNSIGIDCDPLACLIAGAKTAKVSYARIKELGECIRRTWCDAAEALEFPMPGLENFTHWFAESTWAHLQSLMAAIRRLRCSDDERRFVLCVFSSIIRWVSNADDQTQKTYVSGTLKKKPPEVHATFWKSFDRAVSGLHRLQIHRLPRSHAQVIQADATDLQLPESSIDLVVTSPPYLDSVDYMYNFMLEYFWLGPLIGVNNVVVTHDYTSSGFDRGHMCDHSDRAATIESSFSTFVMTNIVPQAPNNNRKCWAQLENYCRELARSGDRLYILSGPAGRGGVGSNGPAETIGSGRIVVPAFTWKVIVVTPDNGQDNISNVDGNDRVIAVDVPNDQNQCGEEWAGFRCSPASIEAATGLRFFSALPQEIRDVLDSKVDSQSISSPRPLIHRGVD